MVQAFRSISINAEGDQVIVPPVIPSLRPSSQCRPSRYRRSFPDPVVAAERQALSARMRSMAEDIKRVLEPLSRGGQVRVTEGRTGSPSRSTRACFSRWERRPSTVRRALRWRPWPGAGGRGFSHHHRGAHRQHPDQYLSFPIQLGAFGGACLKRGAAVRRFRCRAFAPHRSGLWRPASLGDNIPSRARAKSPRDSADRIDARAAGAGRGARAGHQQHRGFDPAATGCRSGRPGLPHRRVEFPAVGAALRRMSPVATITQHGGWIAGVRNGTDAAHTTSGNGHLQGPARRRARDAGGTVESCAAAGSSSSTRAIPASACMYCWRARRDSQSAPATACGGCAASAPATASARWR